MQKINFQNLPNTTTPVNATNLNQLQTNIENAINDSINEFVSSGTIETLVSTLISNMTHNGIYNFTGSWTEHSWGYTAICQRAYYDDSNYAYSGIVFEYANGYIYTFTKRTTQNAVINKIV